ncbi:hypothetical protein ACFLYJ_03280 [Candidatus Cloacimonadota bacterium]
MNEIIDWLLSGDISIQFQTKRDLLKTGKRELEKLQKKIAAESWGKSFLEKRNSETGQWGNGWYSPKWISTHYTLLELKSIGIHPANPEYLKSAELLLDKLWFNQGKVRKDRWQDMCVAGMILGMCCYAHVHSPKIDEIVDYILDKHYADGGWNCMWQAGHTHSSLHTTLSILEGIKEYENSGYYYRIEDLCKQRDTAHEFILRHHLYKSERTGEVIKKSFTMLSFPGRWFYNILRCMDYFQSIDLPYDERMQDALNVVMKKQRKNGRWPLQHKIQGLVHFDMEKAGTDSRWNTLRALRVLKKYGR